jgi:hypothetical protein
MPIDAPAQLRLPANVHSFLTRNGRYATLATVDSDGAPHQILVWYLLRSRERDGERLVVNSRRGRRWPTNLLRDGRASFSVSDAGDAVAIECEVEETYGGEEAQADIAEMARRYDSAEEAASGIATFRTQERVSFVLRPVRVHEHGEPA